TIFYKQKTAYEISGNWWAAGENVGMGPSCSSIQDAFMSSPGHKANILDRDYNQVGVGVSVKDGTIYVTVDFAGRKTSSSTTTVRRTTTTTRTTTVTHRTSTVTAAAKPKPKPRPKPRPALKPVYQATPRTVP